jgi:hypothetical protein
MLAERHLLPRLLDSRTEAITLAEMHHKAMKEVSWALQNGLLNWKNNSLHDLVAIEICAADNYI